MAGSRHTRAKAHLCQVSAEHEAMAIAIMYQNDDFGKDLLKASRTASRQGGIVISPRQYEVPTDIDRTSQTEGYRRRTFMTSHAEISAQAIKRSRSRWKPDYVQSNVGASWQRAETAGRNPDMSPRSPRTARFAWDNDEA